jgi:pentatricopeptide repeat protein
VLAVRAHFARQPKDVEGQFLDSGGVKKLLALAPAASAAALPTRAQKISSLTPSVFEAAQAGDWNVAAAALEEGDFKTAEVLMEELITVSVEPAAVCFNAIIKRCSCENDADRAAYWLEDMLVRGIAPDATTFNPVISMLARKGDVDEAFRWLGLMRLSHVEPDVQCYKTLLCACSAIDDMARAQQLFDEMLPDGGEERRASKAQALCSAPSVEASNRHSKQDLPDVCYNTAVQAWAEVGRPQLAEHWLRQAVGAGCQICLQSYSSVIEAFDKAGLQAEAERWRKLSDIAARAAASSREAI